MDDLVSVQFADDAVTAVAIGAVVMGRTVPVLLSSIVLRPALQHRFGLAVIINGLVLQEAETFVRPVIPARSAITANIEATVIPAVNGLALGRVECETVAVGVDALS